MMPDVHNWHCDICGDSVAVDDWRSIPTRYCDICKTGRPIKTRKETETEKC